MKIKGFRKGREGFRVLPLSLQGPPNMNLLQYSTRMSSPHGWVPGRKSPLYARKTCFLGVEPSMRDLGNNSPWNCTWSDPGGLGTGTHSKEARKEAAQAFPLCWRPSLWLVKERSRPRSTTEAMAELWNRGRSAAWGARGGQSGVRLADSGGSQVRLASCLSWEPGEHNG
jgi:hypothetical protein